MSKSKPLPTAKERDLRGLKKFASLAGDQFTAGELLHSGDETMLKKNMALHHVLRSLQDLGHPLRQPGWQRTRWDGSGPYRNSRH